MASCCLWRRSPRWKKTGEITKCEFHRAGGGAASWVGICTEQNLQGDREHDSMATLSQFSDTRLEGSTKDIPVFVMTPVERRRWARRR